MEDPNKSIKLYGLSGLALLALSGLGYIIYKNIFSTKTKEIDDNKSKKNSKETNVDSNKNSNKDNNSNSNINVNTNKNLNSKENLNENNKNGNLGEIYDIYTFSNCLKAVLNHCFDSICVFTTSIKKLEKEILIERQKSKQESNQELDNQQLNAEISNFFRSLEHEKARIIASYGLSIAYYNKSLDLYKTENK